MYTDQVILDYSTHIAKQLTTFKTFFCENFKIF